MLNEQKVFKDNVLGYVKVDDQIIWDLINTPEFQRLRRIRHLGGLSMVFHTGEHSRFSHSLGVYEITRRMIGSIDGLVLTPRERILVLCSALLHDIGHGPLSHAFETISSINHENVTIRIIKESSNVSKILNQYDAMFINDICNVLQHKYENPVVTSIISSQIDADRLDYLVRDSYNSGVVYGITDLDRLFRIAKIVDDKICFKYRSIKELEIYLLSRMCMYEQVYFHPNGRSYELLFQMALLRYNDLKLQGYNFKHNYDLLENISDDISLEQFFLLDDATVIHYMKCFMMESDCILSDLSRRFINRDLFKFIDYYMEGEIAPFTEDVKNILNAAGYDEKYYLATDTLSTKFYRFDEAIYICDDDKIVELDDVSDVVSKLSIDENVTHLYFPAEIMQQVKQLLK